MDAAVDVTDFDYRSIRAHKARFGVALSGSVRQLMSVMAVVFAIGGIALVAVGFAVGWLLVGLAAIPALLVVWYDGELKHIPENKHAESIDDVISSDVLGRLPENPTALDIANAAGAVPSGQFFAARFGITARMISDLGAAEAVSAESVWGHAVKLMQETNQPRISAPVLVMALLRSIPDYQTILAHLSLTEDDIVAGIRWHEHLRELIVESRKPKLTGGIARDWAFGYIPTLERFGQNLSEQIARGRLTITRLASRQLIVDQLIDIFTSSSHQNAVVVGKVGGGKTTIVQSLAARLIDAQANVPNSLKFWQVIMLDATSLLSAAPGRGELEGLVARVLNEAYQSKNIIICLDNAQVFFNEGTGSVDLSTVLLPVIEAGGLRMIMTMDEQSYLELTSRSPELASSLNRVTVSPTTEEETYQVMQDEILTTEFRRKVTYTYQSLKEAYRLSERYIYDQTMPGQALKLLEAAASYHENGLVTINSVQKAVEQTLDVKVSVASQAQERDKLLNLEDLIHQRMINQTRAVQVVSDALRRARSGVRSQDRPIGTFLFLGPTGVGKTELAKALAEVYFDGEDKIIRLDMNEFVHPNDVARLIADGASNTYSLTAQIMKQPFSVVLLDEIEKAHPSVLSTLLQLLDEGILRDSQNREISFRDSIIIATSNAGSARIREYIERGYQLNQFEKQFVDELISSNQFTPEFVNRFDELVVFRPLEKPELEQVVDLMIAGVNKTLAQQNVSVEIDAEVRALLVERGYDPRLGARPMRRMVQQVVENTVARRMLEGNTPPGSVIQITYDQVQATLEA